MKDGTAGDDGQDDKEVLPLEQASFLEGLGLQHVSQVRNIKDGGRK